MSTQEAQPGRRKSALLGTNRARWASSQIDTQDPPHTSCEDGEEQPPILVCLLWVSVSSIVSLDLWSAASCCGLFCGGFRALFPLSVPGDHRLSTFKCGPRLNQEFAWLLQIEILKPLPFTPWAKDIFSSQNAAKPSTQAAVKAKKTIGETEFDKEWFWKGFHPIV